MHRIARTAVLFAALASPVHAAEVPPPPPPPAAKPQEMDMSRSVTLTGRELQALVTAQVAQARAQETAQAAAEVSRKVSEALTPKDAH